MRDFRSRLARHARKEVEHKLIVGNRILVARGANAHERAVFLLPVSYTHLMPVDRKATFEGYVREDGRVGIRIEASSFWVFL